MTMDGFTPGIYPQISMDDLQITVGEDTSFGVESTTFKPMDLSTTIATLESAPDTIDQAWFEENARALFPAWEGFALSGVDIDIPDETTGERIVASIASFDLSLSDYLNGIPTAISSVAENVVFDIPQNTADEQLAQLLALGVETIDAGFTIASTWNEEDNTISIDEFSLTGADLATVTLTGTISNALAALFDSNPETALAASMELALQNLTLDIRDEGLSDIILAQVAAEQGSDPAQMRPVFAGLAEGTIISFLAGAAEAQKVGEAVSSFVSGQAKHLTIDVVAKDEAGVPVTDFMAAEQDPTELIGKVTVDATAK
jgi:hypothetical protein